MKSKKLTMLGLTLALVFVLSAVERMLPPLPLLPPQFSRLGLSNIAIMYLAFFVGKKEAIMIAVLKSVFVLLTRGPTAFILSLSGGLLSVFIIILLIWLFRKKVYYIALSVAGAIGHNIGQLITACIIMQNWLLFGFYLPVLIISGTVVGTATGILLKRLLPILRNCPKIT
ncbi:MAG: Gx transporter family protein [Defluviitaleaceae bacterium]|nr:Gx transporter family protein [Defluviitaleaceae bacterium]